MKTINTLKKVSLATLLTFVLSFSSVFAQNDTMYIMKSGSIVGQYNVNTEVDSVIFYKPTIEEATSGTFTDARDGKVYNWVKIGDQVWMAENLNVGTMVTDHNTGSTHSHQTNNSIIEKYCYENDTNNCAIYGGLYEWNEMMQYQSSSTANPSGIQGVCPDGWHLPSDAEWVQMENYLADNFHNYDGTEGGGRAKIAKSLASTSGWIVSSTTGAVGNTDYPTYRNKSGFTALPGGNRGSSGTFLSIGGNGHWWSATEDTATNAWSRNLNYYSSSVDRLDLANKVVGFSVRCLRD